VKQLTEDEWLVCNDPERILRALEGKVSDRKFRLFMAGCCRRVPRMLRGDLSRLALEWAEGFADGTVSASALETIHRQAFGELIRSTTQNADRSALFLAQTCSRPDLTWYRIAGISTARELVGISRSKERLYQIAILKDIVGNVFRPASMDDSWLAWNAGTVPRMAARIYEQRRLPEGTLNDADLAVLGDALEDAGCDNAEILAHCRGAGPHVRGCWVVDLAARKV
jgi:hypothetical protein